MNESAMAIGQGTKVEKLSLSSKLGYGFGEAGSQCSWTIISSYLTVFYTDVVGLTPLVISTIMLVARVWDAVNDPMFGSIAENSNFKFGRYRSWILFGLPFLVLFSCLAFLDLDISNSWKGFWCGFTYIFCGMAYTVVNLSTGALSNTMTANPAERTQLQSFRGAFSTIVGFVLSMATMPIILHFGNGSTSSARGYFIAALIFALISVPFFLLCIALTKEVILGKQVKKEKEDGVGKKLTESFKVAFSDRDTRNLVLAVITNMVSLFGRQGITVYFFIYVVKNPMLMSVALPAMLLGMLLTNFYAPFLLKVMNKKTAGVLGAIGNAISLVGIFLTGQAGMNTGVVICTFLNGLTNCSYIVMFSLAGDIIDDNWIRTGKRTEGVTYAVISFATKLGNAIGGSVGIVALAAAGYVANTEMSGDILTKMNAIINLSPIIFLALAMFFYARIRMNNAIAIENEKKVREILKAEAEEVL
jgi:GPH family glycoside/pentoside/hexuronide:cation symporter/probable glucitol transport protein GutA